MTQQISKKVGQATVALYLLESVMPLSVNIQLYVLSIGSAVVTFSSFSRKNIFIPKHLFVIAIFFTFMAIAIAASESIVLSLFSSAPFLPAMLIFILIVSCFETTDDIFRLYLLISFLPFFLCLNLLGKFLIHDMESPYQWINQLDNQLLVVPNDSIIFSIIAPLSIILLLKKPCGYLSVIAGMSILLSIISIILLRSRGALLIMIVSILPILFNKFNYKKISIIIVLIITITFITDGATGFKLLEKYINSGYESRIPLWQAAWALFLDHPLLGYGPHMFVFQYQNYLPVKGEFITDTWITPWAHNLYLELLSEEGLLVTIAFLSLLAFNFYHAIKIMKHNDEKISLAGLGVASSLIGFAVAAIIELSFLRIWVVLIFFILLSIIHNLSANLQETCK
jgi:O-antigen ligase